MLISFDVALLGWYDVEWSEQSPKEILASPWLRRGILVTLWFALVLIGGVLILRQSRMGLVAGAVALFVWFALSDRWVKMWQRSSV